MPQRHVVTAEVAFHYEGPHDFDALMTYLREVEQLQAPEQYFERFDDGSMKFHERLGSTVWWVYPGMWRTRVHGFVPEEEFRRVAAPLPAWPDEEGGS